MSQAQKSPHRGGLLVWLQGAGVTKLCRSQHLVQVAQGSMAIKNPARWPGYGYHFASTMKSLLICPFFTVAFAVIVKIEDTSPLVEM